MKSKRIFVILSIVFALAILLFLRMAPNVEFTPWSYSETDSISVTFSPNDDCFAVLANAPTEPVNTRLMVVSRRTGRMLLDTSGVMVLNPCFDQHAKYCAVFIGSELAVFDLSTGSKVFGKNRTEIFEGRGAAMGFTQDSDTLILEQFSWSFGFEMEPPPKLAFSIPSGERVDATASPSCWYGRNLSIDGSMCFAVGFHDSTPRVFRRNGDFVGYCYRHPSIVNAWFTRNNAELLSLHTDGALIRWDLSNVNEHKQVQSVSLSMQPELLEFHGVVPLNSESAFALIDRSGRMTRFVVPD